MSKDSAILLQNLDCNCNNCKFMERDFATLCHAQKDNRDYYAWSYRKRRANMWSRAKQALAAGNQKRHDDILKLRTELRLDTSYKSGLYFGVCRKFEKPISFIPNIFQFETQRCFENRK